eukprot:CAMPEP_0113523728 /NCGR_PEP_ID=MMETSP0014_2-20120614/45852_1 /TAXON_ID=2857 /ORGANISM="Nitzschia sp." /LENGTH=636 /DNA_ID=CAMNT_0000421821 /DNA_START=229 /DNA_END=2135 /DNA_ORIENTATION=- /assembly_acc=CAM_ASM_000159
MTIHIHKNSRDDDGGSSTRQQQQGRRFQTQQRIKVGSLQVQNNSGNPGRRRQRKFFFFVLTFVGGVLSFLWLSMFAHNIGHASTFDYYYSSAATTLNDFVTASTSTSTATAAATATATATTADDAGSSSSSAQQRRQKVLSHPEVSHTDFTTDRSANINDKSKKNNKIKKIKLQDKLDRFYLEHGYSYNETDYNGGLWHYSDYVPSWMSQYFDWHKQQLQELKEIFDNNNNVDNNHVVSTLQDSNHKLLVMQCLKTSDNKCGGTADRLKAFLYLLKEAAIMKRVLFLHWTSPCDIKDFLVPPIGGFDWRAPPWLQDWLASPVVTTDAESFHLLRTQNEVDTFRDATVSSLGTAETSSSVSQNQGRGRRRKKQVSSSLLSPSTPIVRTRLQSITGFDKQYNEHPFVSSSSIGKGSSNTEKNDDETAETEPAFEDVYHDVWRIAFRPSRPVAELIEQEFFSVTGTSNRNDSRDNRGDNSGLLIPNRFVGVHLRAMYGARSFRTTAVLMDMVSNGLNCGSIHQYHDDNNNNNKMKSDEYFFASDLGHALELAQEYGTSKKVLVHVVHGVMENQGLVPEKSLAAVKEEGHQHADGPLHFAKADNLHSRKPSEFYSTFVDLFILGMGRCTIVNRGGFGTFG